MLAQRGKVEIVPCDHGGHSSAPIAAIDGDSVDVGFQYAIEATKRELDLGGRHILSLPAECVADAINEIEIAEPVLSHDVPGAEPGIPLLEHVLQHFLVRVCLARVALEARARPRRIALDPADDLARLIDAAFDAEAIFVTRGLQAHFVEAAALDGKPVRQPPRQPADGAFPAV